MTEPRSIHLIGIAGAGISAIARLLLERGYRVSGSDRQLSPLSYELQQAGIRVYQGHSADHIAGADLVIRSSAIPDDNVEVQAARQAGIPVVKRSDFLGQLMADQVGIAVAGTHGKTTTTAMIAWMLTALGQDPSYIIGGVSLNLKNNAHAGRGSAFVIEADEYDRTFLGLRPQVAVVTNIEHDHPDCYPTPEDFYQAFLSFARNVTPDGCLVAGVDDAGVRRLAGDLRQAPLQVITFGIDSAEADWRADLLQEVAGAGYRFTALYQSESAASLSLQAPGLHNVRNALAALAVAQWLRLPLEAASRALSEFVGTSRRFEVRGEAAGVVVIDDYAHHPTEIRATLSAARQRYPDRRIWAVWQPHTYSRTQALFDQFVAAFESADGVVVTEIFASREASQIGKFSSQTVVTAMNHPRAFFIPSLPQVVDFLVERLLPGDVLIVMSAGDADQVSAQLLKKLEERDYV